MYIIALKNSISFFNYKHSISIVYCDCILLYFHCIPLMCVAGAKRKIIMAEIGSKRRFSNGGIFVESEFGIWLKNNTLNLPQPKPLTQNGEPVPFVFIGDEAFPLSKNLRPYLRDQLDVRKRIFNYRLSRARRIIEATFGVLKSGTYTTRSLNAK